VSDSPLSLFIIDVIGPNAVIEMPTEAEPVKLLEGDCLEVMPTLPTGFKCCVTSPPYWGGLRDYGMPAQLGLERDPSGYVAAMVTVFGEVRRLLLEDGVLWLNIGDVYAASGKGGGGCQGDRVSWETVKDRKGFRMPPSGYKMKDLTLVPFQVADALRRDGWYLRKTVIWEKPAATEPERLDRPSLSHEYLFLFAKSEHYATRNPGEKWWGSSVWRIGPNLNGDHPATMPRELARRCVVSSSKPGDLILDPFGGSGTTGHVAIATGRRAVLIELNPEYLEMGRTRVATAMGRGPGSLFAAS
jgi:site-specific DNA-methyltransferase (cytosine-N4-specific)